MMPCWGLQQQGLGGRLRTEAQRAGIRLTVALAAQASGGEKSSRLCLLRLGTGSQACGLGPPGTSDQMAGLGDGAWFLSQVPPWEQLWTRPGRTVHGIGHQPEPEPLGG